mgnify:FL=1
MACLKKIRKSQKGLIFKKIQFPGLRSFSIMPIPVKNKPFWARRMHECISGDPEQAKNNNNTDLTVRIPAAGAAVRSGTGTLRLQGRVPPVTHQKKALCGIFWPQRPPDLGMIFLRSLRMENLRCPDNRVDLRKLKKNFKDIRKCIC